MASSNMNIDSADEAGGESVFTSDGLPSLVAPLPPPPLPSIGGIAIAGVGAVGKDGCDDAVIIEEESNPREAFEAFSDSGAWINNNSNAAAPSIGGITTKSWVDPRRRLFQLKSELDSLESQLANEKQNQTNNDNNEENSNDDLHAMTAELKSRLVALGMDGDASSLASMLRGRQEDLSCVIARDLKQFGGSNKGEDISKAMESLSLKGELKEGSKVEGEGGKIVYELYGSTDGSSATTSATVPREVQLEERLRKLELAMGAASTTCNTENKSIMERLAEAEKLSKEVDAKTVEKLAAKAKVVRADLEAAARARAKLASKSTNNNSTNANAKEDAKTITELHSQLVELEGISAHLPALTLRLVELSNLHTCSSEFASRLAAAEAVVGRSEGTLASVENALEKMEGGWKENMEAVEKNVERLDELLLAKS